MKRERREIKEHPLKRYFRRKGIYQDEISTVMGISQTLISFWFNCKEPIPKEAELKLRAIAKEIKSGNYGILDSRGVYQKTRVGKQLI